jgi:hypothetical protein
MSLETATTLAGLVTTNPTSGDPEGQGDDHIRLVKTVLKAQFPGAALDGYNIPITATEVELNYVHGVTSAIQTQFQGVVPIGGIIMWAGALIPANWYLCDGTNGTPDLQDKFIVGKSTTKAITTTGGTADAVVVAHDHTASSTGSANFNTSTESGTHTHGFTTGGISANHTHSYTAGGLTGGNVLASGYSYKTSDGIAANTGAVSSDHTHSGTTVTQSALHVHGVNGAVTVGTTVAASGVTGVGANLPPYYALAFIQRYQ